MTSGDSVKRTLSHYKDKQNETKKKKKNTLKIRFLVNRHLTVDVFGFLNEAFGENSEYFLSDSKRYVNNKEIRS